MGSQMLLLCKGFYLYASRLVDVICLSRRVISLGEKKHRVNYWNRQLLLKENLSICRLWEARGRGSIVLLCYDIVNSWWWHDLDIEKYLDNFPWILYLKIRKMLLFGFCFILFQLFYSSTIMDNTRLFFMVSNSF